jgi:hypothetical protein
MSIDPAEAVLAIKSNPGLGDIRIAVLPVD